jgi:Tol biopolymer transport system component
MRVLHLLCLLPLLQASNVSAQSRIITPGSNLVTDGLPAIPADVAEDVRRYTEFRPALLSDWHPVNREMLIGTRFGNTTQLHNVKTPLGARRQLTFFDEPVSFGTFEPRTGKYFLYTRDAGGNEFAQMYRYDFATGRSTLLSDGGRSQNGEIRWNRDGTRISFGSTRRNGADRDIYVMDPMDPKSSRMVLEVSGGGWSAEDWSPDGTRLLVNEFLSINSGIPWIVDVATGKKERLLPGVESIAFGTLAFSRDGRRVYVTSDKDSEFLRLAVIDLATRSYTPLTSSINWDVSGV